MNTAERKFEKEETYEKQGDTEILVGLEFGGVLLRSLSVIHRIENVPDVIVLEVIVLEVIVFEAIMTDGLKVDPEGLLNAMDRSQLVRHQIKLRTP